MAKLIFEQRIEEVCPKCGGDIMEAHYKKFMGKKVELKCQSCSRRWGNRKELEDAIRRNKHNAEMRAELQNAIENGELPYLLQVESSMILKKDEKIHLSTPTVLHEEKRKYSPVHSGVKIVKKVWIGEGKGYGKLRAIVEPIDSGDLILTSQRLVFKGDKYNRMFPLEKIVSLELYENAIEVGIESHNKLQIFKVDDPEKWNVFIRVAIEKQDN